MLVVLERTQLVVPWKSQSLAYRGKRYWLSVTRSYLDRQGLFSERSLSRIPTIPRQKRGLERMSLDYGAH